MPAGTTILTVRHVAAEKEMSLPISVTSFVQDTVPNFSSTQVYGRMDPIFTYQNTTRTFLITCQTALYAEFRKLDESVIPPALKGTYDAAAADTAETAVDVYQSALAQKMSALYQMMYPLLERQVSPTRYQLKGPPVLNIKVSNVLGQANEGTETDFVFVPQTFSVTSGMPDAAKSQILVTGPSDLKYIVPQGTFGFILGGTILQFGAPPGFVKTTTGVGFIKEGFPLGSPAMYSPKDKEILK